MWIAAIALCVLAITVGVMNARWQQQLDGERRHVKHVNEKALYAKQKACKAKAKAEADTV